MTMLDVTLQLTRAERAYVFLKDDDGKLRLAAGRNSKKEPLLDDKTISHSILEESHAVELRISSDRHQPVARSRRPAEHRCLRSANGGLHSAAQDAGAGDPRCANAGARHAPLRPRRWESLYVDSRFASRDISGVGQDILHVIATEAASLIENARLVQAEEEARRYQQELSIAASIQQRLMQVKIPEVPFARLRRKESAL